MKKWFRWVAGVLLATLLTTVLLGCGEQASPQPEEPPATQNDSGGSGSGSGSGSGGSSGGSAGNGNGSGNGSGGSTSGGGSTSTPPKASPLAALDVIDVGRILGDRTADDWWFAFDASADFTTQYTIAYTSYLTDHEYLNTRFEASLTLGDKIGAQKNEQNVLGMDLFGGGNIGLALSLTDPNLNAPYERQFDATLTHDGDWIRLKEESGEQRDVELDDLGDLLTRFFQSALFTHLQNAATSLPNDLKQGLNLRAAVEKLVAVGFEAEVENDDGLSVTLRASHAWMTDLINDVLYGFLPESWREVLPRMDVSYSSDLFQITLGFNAAGLFKTYQIASNVAYDLTLDVPLLGRCTSGVAVCGNLGFNADSVLPARPQPEVPEEPEVPEPEVPGTSEVPETSEEPEAPGASEVPETSEEPTP